MDKHDFLLALEARLAGLPEADRQASLDFYSEMLDDLVEGGMSETEAVASLGSPEAFAEEILLEMPLPKLVKAKMKKRRLSGLEITLLAVGFPLWLPIGIALLAVVFAIYISLWAVVISLYAVFVALAASSLGCILAGFFMIGGTEEVIVALGAAALCAGLSILILLLANLAAKGLV